MNKFTLITCLAVWATFSSVSFAQVSTFPNPPPLLPNTEPATNGPSSAIPAPPPLAPMPDQDFQPATNSTPNVSPREIPSNPLDGTAVPGSGSSPAPNTPATTAIPVSASTLNSMTALDDKVILAPGDRISFRVIEDRDEAVPRVVTDTGEVDFPYIGRLKIAGLTCRQVAQQLKKLLEVDYYKRATVIVGLDVIAGHTEEVSTQEVAWIVGQVRQEGPQALPKQPLTVSQVILRAGGFAEFADERKVRVVHRASAGAPSIKTSPESQDGDSEPGGQLVDVKSVFEGHSAVDPVVQPNDLIIIPKRLINF